MKAKFLMTVFAAMTIMVCGGAVMAYAQGPAGHGGSGWGMHDKGPMGHMLADLNLTDAQQQQVKAIHDANKAGMVALMQQMTQNRIAMLQATSNGAYDQAKIQTLATQQAQIEAQMSVQHQALEHQIYTQVLTAEQRTQFDQKRAGEISRMTEHLQKMQAEAATPAQ